MKLQSRYIVGIDLGTTTCSLSYIDTIELEKGLQRLLIPQWANQDSKIEKSILPSFCFIKSKSMIKQDVMPSLTHKDEDYDEKESSNDVHCVLGEYAKKEALFQPDRVCSSAKSWFCHRAIDGHEKIIPWNSDVLLGQERLSPIAVSSLYLKHLKTAWNDRIAQFCDDYRLENQKIILTVPASFDEVACQYTIEAAELAGLSRENIKLIEEPQAAFYNWIGHSFAGETPGNYISKLNIRVHDYLNKLPAGAVFLVCDIGGGTTDFSLIAIDQSNNVLPLKRIRVSDHILLGGDNLDHYLAHELEERFKQADPYLTLNSKQRASLIYEGKQLKEESLNLEDDSDGNEESYMRMITLVDSGSNLFAHSRSIRISLLEVKKLLLDNFFTFCQKDDQPIRKEVGIRQWGLPYARDTHFFKHLAFFLKETKVFSVLFAGGSLIPKLLRERFLEQINLWQKGDDKVKELSGSLLDLSVSSGAAWYGFFLKKELDPIHSGYAKNLFLEVYDTATQKSRLLCLIPKGFASDQKIEIASFSFKLLVNKPVRFRLFYSHDDASYKTGDLLDQSEGQFSLLAPIQTVLTLGSSDGQKRKKKKQKNSAELIAVKIECQISKTGLLQLVCCSQNDQEQSWDFVFSVHREGDYSDKSGDLDSNALSISMSWQQQIEMILKRSFSPTMAEDKLNPNHLLDQMETAMAKEKGEWTLTELRLIYSLLEIYTGKRSLSEQHEANWFKIAGYCLRPGYGTTADQVYIDKIANLFNHGLSFAQSKQALGQWWIFWRRIAGGLSTDLQQKIYHKVYPQLRKGEVNPEVYLLIGSLERIDVASKIKIVNMLINQIKQKPNQYRTAKLWAIARMATRSPLYGNESNIIPPAMVSEFMVSLDELLDNKLIEPKDLIKFYQLSGKMIGNKDLDLNDRLRSVYINRLQELGCEKDSIQDIVEIIPESHKNRELLFGESLPVGLYI